MTSRNSVRVVPRCEPALIDRVVDVVALGAGAQVCGVDTTRYVTRVHDDEPGRNRAVVEFVGVAMGEDAGAILTGDVDVPGLITDGPSEDPAAVRAIRFLDSRPETVYSAMFYAPPAPQAHTWRPATFSRLPIGTASCTDCYVNHVISRFAFGKRWSVPLSLFAGFPICHVDIPARNLQGRQTGPEWRAEVPVWDAACLKGFERGSPQIPQGTPLRSFDSACYGGATPPAIRVRSS